MGRRDLILDENPLKCLSKDQLWALKDCTCCTDIVNTLKDILSINESNIQQIKSYLFDSLEDYDSDMKKEDMTSRDDMLFLKFLIQNNGVILEKSLYHNTFFCNDYYGERSAKKMTKKNVVLRLKLKNFTIIYVLNPTIITEANKK